MLVNKINFKNIPFFIKTLYEILNQKKYENILYWNDNGEEVIINEINSFSNIVLPNHFRHKKFSSFIRQLNLYGFNKISKSSEEYIFSNKYFKRELPELLKYIRRKKSLKESNLKNKTNLELKNEINELNDILNENKKKYEAISEKNKDLIEDNKTLLIEILNTKKDIEESMENIFKFMYFKTNNFQNTNKEENNFETNDNIFQIEKNN